MTKTYLVVDKLMCGDKVLISESYNLIADKEPTDFSERITWDNIRDLEWPDHVRLDKKRRGMVLHTRDFFWEETFCQWKDDLDLTYVVSAKECKMSLMEIVKYEDSEMAIKYLKERGIGVCMTPQ